MNKGRPKTGSTKKSISFTIDIPIFNKWKIYSKKNAINSSRLINNFLERQIEKGEKK